VKKYVVVGVLAALSGYGVVHLGISGLLPVSLAKALAFIAIAIGFLSISIGLYRFFAKFSPNQDRTNNSN